MTWKEQRIKEEQFLEQLGTPIDDLERTRDHYLCLNLWTDKRVLQCFRREGVALLMVLPVLLYLLVRGLFQKKTKKSCDAVCFCPRQTFLEIMMADLPPELKKNFPQIRQHLWNEKNMLTRYRHAFLNGAALRLWLKMVFRYPAAFYMNLYLLLHLGHLCELIYTYNPRAIISAQTEQDFSTSFMTHFCEQQGIEYIGVMHGETIRSMTRAFVRFTWFYSWNQETVEIFLATKSPKSMFRLYDSKRLNPHYRRKEHPAYYAAYYLGGETETAMLAVRENLGKLAARGYRCKVRFHPRATDLQAFHRVFGDDVIEREDPQQVSLKDSVENAEYIVSVCSTVLSEAYMSGMQIVIDDLSSYITFEDLKNRMYINLKRAKLYLSDLIRQAENG